MKENMAKSGMIALVGRPNVGKSTLLNALVGEKVSIVTPKPQTTRRRLCAVAARGDTQYVFVDTPGFHKPKTGLGEYMVGIARRSIEGVDAAVLLVEPIPNIGPPEEILLERIQKLKVPVILAINKIDTVPREKLLAVIAAYAERFAFHAVVPLSALRKEGLDTLFEELHPLIPEGPLLFPEGEVTDQTDREMIAELFREQILMHLEREVPHGVAVVVETFKETPKPLLEVGVVVVCEKQSHKGIVIGKQGQMLKKIGEKARRELEEMYEIPVMLSSWVRVKEDWRNKKSQLLDLGFDGE